MEEDFIATIKLTTGEELLSKVCYMPDEDSLVLESPMKVISIDQQQKNIRVNGFALSEWIHSTFDHMFILPKEHVLTMTEVEDERLQFFFNDCVQKHITQITSFRETFEPKKFTRKMGSLGSAQDTRRKLEELFKRS